jgi:predicted peptidase
MKKVFILLSICCLSQHLLFAQDFELFERHFLQTDDLKLPYRVLLPEDYDPNKEYPLLLFLHGAGERGDDNEQHLIHGAKLFLTEENRKKFPAIVVFPQCPDVSFWTEIKVEAEGEERKFNFASATKEPIPATKALLSLIDHLYTRYAIDPKRQYIMGLSMGGFGTLHMLSRLPDTFAAAVVICGGGNQEDAHRYAGKLPLWLTHGDQDPVVPVSLSRQMVSTLKFLGAKVKYSEFPGVDHNAWDPTFEIPELLPWIFSHSK